jgi:O-antigen/teichoic acid export membrane protein
MSELKGKAIHGIRWTTLSAVITAGGGLLQTIILTRLLERSDFGLMAIINVMLGFAMQLVDMGFGTALLREKDPKTGLLNSLFTLNTSLGFFFAIILWLVSNWFSVLYQEPKLAFLLKLSSLAFIFSGASIVFQILLQKNLKFKQLAQVEISTFILSFISAVTLAYLGWGVYALVFGILLKTGLSSLLYWFQARNLFRARFEFIWADISHLWEFSYLQTFEKFFNYANINFDTLVIGKVLGRDVLGVYDVCKRLLIQPMYIINPIITKVSNSVMVQVQDDIPRLRNIALRAFQLAITINSPIYIAAFIGAGFIVPVIFGNKWAIGVEPFRWLAAVYYIRAMINPFGGVVIAKNKVIYGLYSQIFISIGLLVAILLGLKGGLLGMLWVLLGFYAILVLGFLYLAIKPLLKLQVTKILPWMHFEVISAILSFSFGYLLLYFLPISFLKLLLYSFLGAGIYAIVLWKLRPNLRTDIRQIITR